MKNKSKNKGHSDGNINIILFLGFIILIFLTCGCSYLFYNMFNAKNPSIVSSLVIHLSNSSKTIDEKDEAVDHKFKIYNKSNISACKCYEKAGGVEGFAGQEAAFTYRGAAVWKNVCVEGFWEQIFRGYGIFFI